MCKMKRILKVEAADIGSGFSLELPVDAGVVSLAFQREINERRRLCLWYECAVNQIGEPKELIVRREFIVVATGQVYPQTYEHVFTAYLDPEASEVWHLVEYTEDPGPTKKRIRRIRQRGGKPA